MARESKIIESIRAVLANFDFSQKSSFEALKSKFYHIFQLFWTLFVPEKVATNIFLSKFTKSWPGKQKNWVYRSIFGKFWFFTDIQLLSRIVRLRPKSGSILLKIPNGLENISAKTPSEVAGEDGLVFLDWHQKCSTNCHFSRGKIADRKNPLSMAIDIGLYLVEPH